MLGDRWASWRDRFPAVAYLIPWCFVVACDLKVKLTLLRGEGAGYDFVAELLGLPNGGALSWTQRLGLLRDDLLLMGVILPAILIVLLRFLPRRLRAATLGLVSLVAFSILYVELKCYWEVGTFLPARVIGSGAFGAGRELIATYLTAATTKRLLIALGLLVAMTVALHRAQSSPPRPRIDRWVVRFGGAAVLGFAVIALASAFVRIPPSPYGRSAFGSAWSSFMGSGAGADFSDENFRRMSADSLVATYARMARAPVPNRASPYFGVARDNDVVVFLFESLPLACAELPEADTALANLHSLNKRGFVAESHFATYPYSRRAYTSIFTSWYPSNGMRGLIETYSGASTTLYAPGMVRRARAAGYETVAFVPEKPQTYERDEIRYASVGFTTHLVPSSAMQSSALDVSAAELRDLHRTRDRQAFDSLKAYARRAIRGGRRFFYSFNPQLTHGPWPDISQATTEQQVCRNGLPLFAEVDAMLGELVALLREEGRLSRTIIVALGDHGLRTRRELPGFSGGTLDGITFKVPLVIWAPSALDSTRHITWTTSHIDVAPSVLDLLGIDAGRSLELGSPVWDERVADRKTYFLAQSYLGAAGYVQHREALMLKYLFGGVFRAQVGDSLHFEARDMLTATDSLSRAVTRELHTLAKIQMALGRTMLPAFQPAEAQRGASGPAYTRPVSNHLVGR